MATAEKVPMLEEGYRKLNNELRRLKSERPEIVEAIEAARAHGDLSENAEYHAAKERQGQIEATIADLEDRLSRAMVIDPTTLSGDKVVFGATVTLVDEDKKKVRYQLVGQTEADANLVHVGFNLLIFVWCGAAVERVLGRTGLIALYLVGAYASALTQWVTAPASVVPMIGASGAISAVVGAFALSFGRAKRVTN